LISYLVALAIVLGDFNLLENDSRIGVAVAKLPQAPVCDGNLVEVQASAPTLSIHKDSSVVRVWLGRSGDSLYVAADLSDTSYYWGDDFVVSFDPDGSGGTATGIGDRQWYLRRDLDSSFVATAALGRWSSPPSIGKNHRGKDWVVASRSTHDAWRVELKFYAPGSTSSIAFRTYDSAPQGWWSWPAPPESTRATSVERSPKLWARVSYVRGK